MNAWLSKENNSGGLVAMALLEATITEDVDALNVMTEAANEQPTGVIIALVSALASALITNLGEETAVEQVRLWRDALIEEEGA